MTELICLALQLFVVALFVRIILSWFPLDPDGVMARLSHALGRVTEPVLSPLRRVLPPLGPIDLSPFVVIIAVAVISRLLGCGGVL